MKQAFAAVKRLLQVALLMLGCTFLVFVIQAASGRDPARAILGQRATPDQVEALRAQLGLDQPLVVQYVRFVGGLLHGDFGVSYYSGGAVGSAVGGWAYAQGGWPLASWIGFAFPVAALLCFATERLDRAAGAV